MLLHVFLLLIVLYIVRRAVTYAVYYRRWRAVCKKVPQFPYNHPIWGMLHEVRTLDDLMNRMVPFVQQTKLKWLHGWFSFSHPLFYLVHPDTAKTILKTAQPKNKGRGRAYTMLDEWTGDGLLVSDGRKWERIRRLLTPAFHYDILHKYFTEYNDVANILLMKISELSDEENSIDVCPLISRATLDTMLRCTLSHRGHIQIEGESHPYVVAVNRLSTLLTRRVYNPLHYSDFVYYLFTKDGKEFRRHCKYVHQQSETIIKQRKKCLEEDTSSLSERRLDFLDALLAAKDDDGTGLTDKEIRDEVDTFLFAGHDTTASAIGWTLYSLAKYPEHQEKIYQEVNKVFSGRDVLNWDDLPQLEYLSIFLKESLRFNCPVPVIARKTVNPITIEGVELPPGATLAVPLKPLMRHPDVWQNPEAFIPERFSKENAESVDPFAFIPFSAGQRNCIGQVFAKNEIKVLLSHIVKTFQIMLDPDHEPQPFAGLVMRSKNGIYLKFVKR